MEKKEQFKVIPISHLQIEPKRLIGRISMNMIESLGESLDEYFPTVIQVYSKDGINYCRILVNNESLCAYDLTVREAYLTINSVLFIIGKTLQNFDRKRFMEKTEHLLNYYYSDEKKEEDKK